MRNVRRLLAGAVVLVVAFTLVACGSSDEPAADDVESSAPASPQAPEPTESEAPEESEPAEEPAGEPPPADALTTKTFLPALKKAVKGNESLHIEMDLDSAGQDLTAEGDARYDDRDPVMSLKMSGTAFGGSAVEVRLVDDAVYVSLPPMTPPGKFVEIDPSNPNDPLAASMGNLTDQLDPLQTFDAFDAGLVDVEYVSQESVAGETLDRYRVEVDFAAAAQAQGAPVPPGAPETLSYDIWLDDDNLMRRIEFAIGQQVSMQMTASQWGEPVEVAAPPNSKIVKAPAGIPAPPPQP